MKKRLYLVKGKQRKQTKQRKQRKQRKGKKRKEERKQEENAVINDKKYIILSYYGKNICI